jgi:hypothetical protein
MRDGNPQSRRAAPRPRREFWEQWWVRIAVVGAVVVAVVTVAILSDPTQASWEAKTWEFVHQVAEATVGRK